MTEVLQVRYAAFQGPSLAASFAAVTAEFQEPVAPGMPAPQLAEKLSTFIPPALMRRVLLPPGEVSFAQLAAALARGLQDLHGRQGLDLQIQRLDGGACRIALGYHDAQASMMALEVGLELATAFFNEAGGRRVDLQPIEARMQKLASVLMMHQPDSTTRALIHAARARGIPVSAVSPGSRIWLYGQGRAGFHGFVAASHQDSLTGFNLARNKLLATRLIVQLGFPGTRAVPVGSVADARAYAREQGFPLVIKPNAGRQGEGVTAHINTDDELVAAFESANLVAPGNVLLEGHVAGDDHRLTVIGGQLIWASCLSPPRVIGDGRRSIAELIEAENEQRRKSPGADIASVQLVLDADMQDVLAKQGLRADDRPAAGVTISLRSTANISRGGTLVDCTAQLHPDNRDMAEALARCFHLDAAGIDFITPDISRSWREVDCAVIEINATPGFSSAARAVQIMQARFPAGCDGRIRTVVLIGAGHGGLEQAAQALQADGACVGMTDSRRTLLGGQQRFAASATLAERVRGLLLDVRCEVLLIGITPAELETGGFPLDRCSLALVSAGTPLSAALLKLVEACSTRVINDVQADDLKRKMLDMSA
ncbi:MAG: ATP-grasp protein [Pseudomonadota bacterium]|nr:ATP-grasp protein [Pseudomonadota bacterium]